MAVFLSEFDHRELSQVVEAVDPPVDSLVGPLAVADVELFAEATERFSSDRER